MPMIRPRLASGEAALIQYSERTNRQLIAMPKMKRKMNHAVSDVRTGNRQRMPVDSARLRTRKLRRPNSRAKRGTKGLVTMLEKLAKAVITPIAVALTPCADNKSEISGAVRDRPMPATEMHMIAAAMV